MVRRISKFQLVVLGFVGLKFRPRFAQPFSNNKIVGAPPMRNAKSVAPESFYWGILTALIMSLVLAACGGGGGSTSASAVPGAGGGVIPPVLPVPPAPPLPATCSTAPAGIIAINLVASRTSGVGPLSVFFDASATTATATTRPFHDLEYQWNFGDAGSGTWGQGTRPGVNSRNTATGPVAAHVYESPGLYTVTLTVKDGTNTVVENCVVITVGNPDVVFAATTTCVAVAAPPVAGAGGCPAGATVVQSSDFDGTISTQLTAGKRRILFNRGETYFVNAAAARIAVPGPGLIGAYGAGAKPIIQSTGPGGPGTRIAMSSFSAPSTADWRIMDLDLDGQSSPTHVGLSGNGSASQITLLRLDAHDLKFGIIFDPSVLNIFNTPTFTSPMWDQLAIVDSKIERIIGGSGGNGVFHGSARFSFMGNLIDDTTAAEHGIRSQYMFKGVISNNTISNIAVGKANITLRGQPFAGTTTLPAGSYSEHIVVSDNLLLGGVSVGIAGTGPQSPGADERVRNQIWERNYFVAGPATTLFMSVEGSEITFRNNLLDMGAGSGVSQGIVVTDGGIIPDPDLINVYNNTFFTNDPGIFQAVRLIIGSNIRVFNNLAYAPNTTTFGLIVNTGATGVTSGGNSSDPQIGGTSPNFVITPPTALTDYNLTPGSYAIGGGVAVPVFSDFFGVTRPAGAIDIGATEQ